MGVPMPITRGLVLLPAVLALASVAHLARIPNGNIDDDCLDVQVSSPGTPGPGTTPEMHHSPTAKRVCFHEGEGSCPPYRHHAHGAPFLPP
jgi:hypothetical protein